MCRSALSGHDGAGVGPIINFPFSKARRSTIRRARRSRSAGARRRLTNARHASGESWSGQPEGGDAMLLHLKRRCCRLQVPNTNKASGVRSSPPVRTRSPRNLRSFCNRMLWIDGTEFNWSTKMSCGGEVNGPAMAGGPAGRVAMVRSRSSWRAPERVTDRAFNIDPPASFYATSCGGLAPTAERTVGSA